MIKKGWDFMKPIIANSYPEYYIETTEDLENIPIDAPSGTVAIMNGSDGLEVYMKTDSGSWNQL
jgi:hypothetical protein